MVRPIIKDPLLLAQKSEPATEADKLVLQDLLDTLKAKQDKIYDLCKECDVSVYDMVLEKIETASRNIELAKGSVLLYHGSKSGIEGDIEPKSRKQCDFGKGFYMGTDLAKHLLLFAIMRVQSSILFPYLWKTLLY